MNAPQRGSQTQPDIGNNGDGCCGVKKGTRKCWRHLRTPAWRERVALLTEPYLLWCKSPRGSAGPEGKALFFTSSSGLGIPFHFSRWLQQQQTELVLLPLTRPVIPSVQTKQPSHYWLQLFGTGNLIPLLCQRPICEVIWWKSLTPIYGSCSSVPSK